VQSQATTRYRLVEGKKPVTSASTAAAHSVPAPKSPDSKAPTGRSMAKATPVAQPAPQVAQAQKPAKAPEPIKAAAVVPAKPAQAEPARPAASAKEPEATGALPSSPSSAEFRWPARGRVISGFGGSGSNEGINIAVPEGTPVKAAEAGTVAYAGSEVKGYGNLVLIRHENGFVSAYAHNGEIEVKRGQKVTRGQVVAKSGQTGNVTSPQLHFEIRKGSTPVDPMPHLAN
jgi:murein DD-endopeptidase MepM/ murein hydrolase activator NlpD